MDSRVTWKHKGSQGINRSGNLREPDETRYVYQAESYVQGHYTKAKQAEWSQCKAAPKAGGTD